MGFLARLAVFTLLATLAAAPASADPGFRTPRPHADGEAHIPPIEPPPDLNIPPIGCIFANTGDGPTTTCFVCTSFGGHGSLPVDVPIFEPGSLRLAVSVATGFSFEGWGPYATVGVGFGNATCSRG